MKIETLEKAKKLQEEIKATKDSLRDLTSIKDRMSVTRKRYGMNDVYYDFICEEYDENLIALKELVEKATPKKVEEKEDICDGVEYIYTRGKCPDCKSYVAYDGYDKYDYCQYCGQRLNWGFKDEN